MEGGGGGDGLVAGASPKEEACGGQWNGDVADLSLSMFSVTFCFCFSIWASVWDWAMCVESAQLLNLPKGALSWHTVFYCAFFPLLFNQGAFVT